MDTLPDQAIHTLRDLRALRRRLKLTQAELGGVLDLPYRTIGRIESGEYRDTPKAGSGRPRRWTTADVLERARALLKRWEDQPQSAERASSKPRKCPLCENEKAA